MGQKILPVAAILVLLAPDPGFAQQCIKTDYLENWANQTGFEEVAKFESGEGALTQIFRNSKKQVMVFKTKDNQTCLVDIGKNFKLSNWNEAHL